jgi:hypothetical protein
VSPPVRIYTASSSATAPAECRGHVLISGSYGGTYNAFHAGRRGIRGVVLNDAGVGKDNAGINGLDYLDGVGLAAATADAMTCHIGDGDHMLQFGRISYVNRCARQYECATGQSVRDCAERLKLAPIIDAAMPPISGGGRYLIRNVPGEPRLVCVDAAPMIEPTDTDSIVVTGSHAALFQGKPDGLIEPELRAVFFSDAGVGLDSAGITRLPLLDQRKIAAGAVSAASARIGDARSILADGILSHVNATAKDLGGTTGMPLREFVDRLLARWRVSS